MKKRIIPFLAIATLLAACGEKPNTPSTSTGTDSVQTEVTKYTITVSKSSDYTVEGLAAEGYEEGATVTFTVTVKNDKKEIDKVIVDGTQLVASNGKYTFKMPSKNVAIVVQLKDKAGVKVATVTVDNESPKVGDVVNVTLKLDNVAVTEGVTVTATTGADLVTIEGTKVTCNKEGAVALEVAATVDGIAYKKDVSFTIGEGVVITSIKTIQDTEATFPGVKDRETVNYASVVTVEGRVLAVTGKGSLFIYDGTAAMYIFDSKGSKTAGVGDYVRVSGTPSRYKQKGKDPYWWQISKDSAEYSLGKLNDHAEIAVPAATDFTEEMLNAYNPAAGDLKHVKFTGKYVESGDFKNVFIGGATKDLSYEGAETLISGISYKFEGYIAEAKSGKHVTFYATKAEVAEMDHVESVSITNGATAELKAGATLQLSASVLPATADPRVTWSSGDVTKAKVDEDGKVTGVAEGTVTITATTVGKDSTGAAKTATISITVTAAEVVDPSQMKKAATISFDYSAAEGKPGSNSKFAAGGIGNAIKKYNGLTVESGFELSLDSSSGEGCAYYVASTDTKSTKFGIEGLKMGKGDTAGQFNLKFNDGAEIVKVVVKTLTSWYPDGKKSSLTINGVGEAFITAAKGGDVEFTLPASTNELVFSSDKVTGAGDFRVLFTGLEIYVK